MEANLTPEENQGTDQAPHVGLTQEQADELIAQGRAYRQELADLRKELEASKKPAAPSAVARSQEQLHADRLTEIGKHDYYCPDCGRLYDYLRECRGGEFPHPPRDVVSTDELKNAPDPTDKDAYTAWEQGHTPATVVAS